MSIYLFFPMLLLLFVGGCKQENSRAATSSRSESEAIFWKRFLSYNQTQWEVSGQLIPPDLQLLALDGKLVQLQGLLSKQPTVIFRYTNAHCDSCLRDIFRILEASHVTQVEPDLLVLSSYKQYERFSEFWLNAGVDLPVYFLPETSAVGPFQMEYLPFLFLTNDSRQILYPFVPPAEHPGSTIAYWRFIQRQIRSPLSTSSSS